jgi:hypothetical protein
VIFEYGGPQYSIMILSLTITTPSDSPAPLPPAPSTVPVRGPDSGGIVVPPATRAQLSVAGPPSSLRGVSGLGEVVQIFADTPQPGVEMVRLGGFVARLESGSTTADGTEEFQSAASLGVRLPPQIRDGDYVRSAVATMTRAGTRGSTSYSRWVKVDSTAPALRVRSGPNYGFTQPFSASQTYAVGNVIISEPTSTLERMTLCLGTDGSNCDLAPKQVLSRISPLFSLSNIRPPLVHKQLYTLNVEVANGAGLIAAVASDQVMVDLTPPAIPQFYEFLPSPPRSPVSSAGGQVLVSPGEAAAASARGARYFAALPVPGTPSGSVLERSDALAGLWVTADPHRIRLKYDPLWDPESGIEICWAMCGTVSHSSRHYYEFDVPIDNGEIIVDSVGSGPTDKGYFRLEHGEPNFCRLCCFNQALTYSCATRGPFFYDSTAPEIRPSSFDPRRVHPSTGVIYLDDDSLLCQPGHLAIDAESR